jgi:peptidoglycan/LPS O-acetylase OafA/YrhL
LPGLLFISPSVINFITGFNIESMDGPFWSLYVEVCFYAVFATAYFWVGAKRSLWLIFGLFIVTYTLNVLALMGFGNPTFGKVAAAMNWLGFLEFGWFTCGALFYTFYIKRDQAALLYALGVGAIAVLTSGMFRYDFSDRLALLCALLVFVSALHPKLQFFLETRFLVFIGFISYPLYLLHNTISIGIVGWLSDAVPQIPAFFLPAIPLAFLCGIAWLIARFVEPSFGLFFNQLIKRS